MRKHKGVEIFILVILSWLITANSCLANSNNALYPGEEIMNAAGYPALVKFIKGKPDMPLVVFVPGDSHLARISYGYPGGNPKDFLSYWLQQEGYSFLAMSYPLENPVYSGTYPDFSIQTWGKQVAEIAKQFITKNNLSNHLILVAWSMGGSIAQSFNAAAQKNGLQVDFFVGLSAVPPIPYIMQSGAYGANKMLPNGLADRKPIYALFTNLLQDQNKYNQHIIIPKEIYQTQFLGNIPVDLVAAGNRYENDKFINDMPGTLEDGGTFKFSDYPWITLIRDDSPTAAKIVLADPASWNFIRAEMVYHNYLANKNLTKLSDKQWHQVMSTMDKLAQNLTLTVHGNHFFFVGEIGAKETAHDISILAARVKQVKQSLGKKE
jgi:pimeloyl-ACP methyl ester carboxylesterase